MNKIQEIGRRLEITDPEGKFYSPSYEILAEEIIRECINIVSVGGEFASRPRLVERLQEHFGINNE